MDSVRVDFCAYSCIFPPFSTQILREYDIYYVDSKNKDPRESKNLFTLYEATYHIKSSIEISFVNDFV